MRPHTSRSRSGDVVARRQSRAAAPPQARILGLQRQAGNAAVSRLMAVQRFGGWEHKGMGDMPTTAGSVNVGDVAGAGQFELTHGDVVTLSADYFTPDDSPPVKGSPESGGLFWFARRPGDMGRKKNTRDDVIFALKDTLGMKDWRFHPKGKWGSCEFSDDVKAAGVARYRHLAAGNESHFAAPEGRDAAGEASWSARDPLWRALTRGGGHALLPRFSALLSR